MEFLNENCKNHPKKAAYGRCAGCWQFFCDECLAERNGYRYCMDCIVKIPVGDDYDQGSGSGKKKPRVPQWLMFILILAMSALLLDIFYLQWGIVGDLMSYQTLYKAKSYGSTLSSFKKNSSDHFIVYYHDAKVGDSVFQQAEPDFAKICSDLLIDPKNEMRRGKFLLILTANDKEYLDVSNEKTARAGALTDYETKSIIINVERSSPTMTSTLPHEMTHAIVFEFFNSGNKIPNWLHEGIASFEEAKFDDSQVNRRSTEYQTDLQQGRHIPVKSMSLKEDATDTQIQIYYAESASIVSYLINQYGMYRFMTLLKNMQAGQALDAALSSVYAGEIPDSTTLESKWLEYLKS